MTTEQDKECAYCGHVTECVWDGQGYICHECYMNLYGSNMRYDEENEE